MLIQQASRDEPEVIDLMIFNVSGDTVTTGMGMHLLGRLEGDAASADGINAVKATGSLPGFVGIAIEDIPANRHGLVRSYGFIETIFYSQETGVTIGPSMGGSLRPAAIPGTWTSGLSAATGHGVIASWETVAGLESPLPTGKGHIKAM